MDKNRRAIIFVFYDGQGVVDSYVYKLLESFKAHCGLLIFAANGHVETDALHNVKQLADEIILRENKGYDVSAYREAFLSINTRGLLENFDEIIFTNNTYFAPLYPFEEMFSVMDARAELDFWGITSAYGGKDIPHHIQSYFIAVRKRMHSSHEFIDFWINMPKIEGYTDAVQKVELTLTPLFEKLGYRSGVYMDSVCEQENNSTSNAVIELIEARCPTLKRRGIVFGRRFGFNKALDNTGLFETLARYSDYDTDLIWENVLRDFPFDAYEYCLNLNKIYSDCPPLKKVTQKIAVVAYARDEREQQLISSYTRHVENHADIFVASPDAAFLCGFKEILHDTGLLGFLKAAKHIVGKYELICVIYLSRNRNIGSQAQKCADIHRLESVLGSENYTLNLVTDFDEKKRLGLSSPSDHILGQKYRIKEDIGDEAYQALKSANIKVPPSSAEDSTALASCCWLRAEVLTPIYENKIEVSAFGRGAVADVRTVKLLRYLTQSIGFYSQKATTMRIAAKELQIFAARYEDFNIELLIKSWIKNKLKKFFK